MSEVPVYVHTENVHNLKAPERVVPHLMKMFKPHSVLDVGCGTGTWLKVFSDAGVSEICGIDGDFVNRDLLVKNIAIENFFPRDLAEPFDLGKKFDMVLSLEVAEHLPASSAKTFIEALAKHSDTIIFSAAIPGQGGQNHINEQWKDYWIEIFNSLGYKGYDILRPIIWSDDLVDWWYKQNMLVFSKTVLVYDEITVPYKNEKIHPDMFLQYRDYIIYLQEYVAELELKLYPPGN